MEASTELEKIVIHPVTREAKYLAELTPDEIREGLTQLAEIEAMVRDAKRKLTQEAWDRKNAGNAVEALEVSRTRSWNPGITGAALDKLATDGVVMADRDTLLVPSTSYKPNGRSLQALVERLTEEGDLEHARILLEARRESINAKVKA